MALVPVTIARTCTTWMKPGEAVKVKGINVEDPGKKNQYESMTWKIMEAPGPEGRVILGHGEKLIRVSVDKVSPATLDFSSVQFDVPSHWKVESWITWASCQPDIDAYLNKWIPLPGDGQNSIMVRRQGASQCHVRPMIMYPRLEELGLEMLFNSTWYGQTAVVIEIDILKPCPAGHIWVFCAWCGRFHLPFDGPGSHRNSRAHEKARQHMDHEDLESLRLKMGFWNVEQRWL